MKQKHIKDAIEAWNSKEYTLAAKILYEQMKEEYRVRWVTDILEVCYRMLGKVEEIEEIHILARDKSKWVKARETFDRIRVSNLATHKAGKHDSVYGRVLDLLENACKVIYNASGEWPQFDHNAGWKVGSNIAELIEVVGDKNFREEIWKAFICVPRLSPDKTVINMSPVDTSKMLSLDKLHLYDNDPEFIEQTINLSKEAITFLENHKWCKRVKNLLFDRGFGYPLGVFFAEIETVGPDADNFVWVIIGDLPPAYMDVSCKNGIEALEAYVDCMEEWVESVFQGKSVEDMIPVNVPPKVEYAEMLKSRLEFIRNYLSDFTNE